MGKFGNNWAISHRNWLAIFAAISLSGLLLWALSLKQQEEERTYLQTAQVTATIVDIKVVEREGYNRFGHFKNTTYITSLESPDGKQFQFMLLQPAPKIGSKVPVLVDIYDDGSRYYHHNQIDWQML